MATFKLNINGRQYEIEAEPDMPLLWAIRDLAGLTGTKFGCGAGLCGACMILIDGRPVRSCQMPVSSALTAKEITTIEGVSDNLEHVVQQAWIECQVPQCGYCQSGQIISAVALLASNPDPTDPEIDAFMSSNLCRCGTYQRIRKAVRLAADRQRSVAS